MPIPDFQSIMLPILRLASTGEVKASDAVEKMADHFQLSSDERNEMQASGSQPVIMNRTHWAITYLVKGNLIYRPKRGYFAITERGRELLKSPPDRITISYMKKFEDFDGFGSKETKTEQDRDSEYSSESEETPEDRIQGSFSEYNSALKSDLLSQIQLMPPAKFETLIIRLMLGMGYGANGSGEHLGRSNDGGIDGIINEDKLGLDIIYLQAKRYATGNTIGVDKIREFAGALDERGATKGVFVTTSHYAPSAIQFAQRISKRIILIDGSRLTDLLIEYNVAVLNYRTFKLKKIDANYFEDIGD